MSDELRYGPNTAAVERMLERLRSATAEELRALADARARAGMEEWETVRDAAWEAFWDVAAAKRAEWSVAWDGAAWDTAWPPAWLAIFAIIMEDLIFPEHFADLTRLWDEVFGSTWEEER